MEQSTSPARSTEDVKKSKSFQRSSQCFLSDEPAKDERHHMGHYGTFEMNSIHGRLFELKVYVESMKYHVLVYFAFTIFALLFWPIAIFLAMLVSMIAGKDRELQMFKVLLVLATVLGCAMWVTPTLIFSSVGFDHFYQLLYVKKEINFLDFVDFFLSELMMLLTIVFSWVFHDICIDTEKFKNSAKQSWKDQRGAYGTDVVFHKAQLHRLRGVVADNQWRFDNMQAALKGVRGDAPATPKGGSTPGCFPDVSPRKTPRTEVADGTMPIEDIVNVLESLPGWESGYEPVTDHFSAQMGEDMGLYADLASLSQESKKKSMWPIDIWLTRTQYYPDVEIDVRLGLSVSLHYTYDMLVIIFTYVLKNSLATTVLIVLALARTLLPRFWLWAVLEGKFWPTDVYGAGGMLVLYSSILTFCVSLVWLGLFYFVIMEYRRTMCQMTIISALVDARTRVKFGQNYLMSMFWFGMDSEQSEAVLAKLPLFDLRTSSNVAAFWRLREYCTLDRCNERMTVSVLLEIVIFWLFLKFAATLGVMYAYGGLPAILIVTLFDLLVFGCMALFSLQIALSVNTMMERHKEAFVEAKYEVTMAYGMLHLEEQKADVKKQKDLDIARRLLTEYLDMTNESDFHARDSILFGMVVTPGKILSSLGTVSAMVATLLAKMIGNGAVKPPKSLEHQLAAVAVHMVNTAATGFLSIYRNAHHVQ